MSSERPRRLDRIDHKILEILQDDAQTPLTAIADRVGLSQTPCWRRIQRLEQDGVLQRRIAILDPAKVGLCVTALVFVEAADHTPASLADFETALAAMPEVIEAHRLAGNVDYMLRVAAPDLTAYERFYARFIVAVKARSVTTHMVLKTLRDHGPLPLGAD